jgi:Tfp pilus assembly protein PilF
MAILATIVSTGPVPGDPPPNKSQSPSGGYAPQWPGARMGAGAGPAGSMNTPGRPPSGPAHSYPAGVPVIAVPGPGYGASYVVPYYGGAPNYALPPVFVPADAIYGPEALQRSLWGDNFGNPTGGPPGVIVAPTGKLQNNAGLDDVPPARGSSHDSLALASKFIAFGDAHFRAQRYGDAYQRYRTAVETAPGMAEACFHEAFALMALGRYSQAAKMLKRGLSLDPTWPKSGFKLSDLYGENRLAKNAHVDALAKAANLDPLDGDLLFVVGVWLYFDGQRERAAPFFQRAAQLADGPHIEAFRQ